jgi:hypothetical protein
MLDFYFKMTTTILIYRVYWFGGWGSKTDYDYSIIKIIKLSLIRR